MLQAAVRKALGNLAVVKTLTDSVQVNRQTLFKEIGDLDKLATKVEVFEVVKDAIQDATLNIGIIKSLRPAFGGQQRAALTLPVATASKLIEKSKIRIGWVVCRIRDQPM